MLGIQITKEVLIKVLSMSAGFWFYWHSIQYRNPLILLRCRKAQERHSPPSVSVDLLHFYYSQELHNYN